LRDAAQNPSGGAGLTAGIGAGMGIGNVLSQSLAGMQGTGAKPPTEMPSVMTPSEAAQFLRVSEEDVMSAIKDKSLKAKKIGDSYRISKESIEAYLAG
jgi:excisionase family DNA binding protein